MKTWCVYETGSWTLLDVVTADDAKESGDVKTWWMATSYVASEWRERDAHNTEFRVYVSEPDHFGDA
jgi:hypothetical protein